METVNHFPETSSNRSLSTSADRSVSISFVIPVFNRPNELEELLASMELQSDFNFEMIVVEDGSELKSEEVCKQFGKNFPIRYFFKQNGGPGLARNYGAKEATGDFIIFLDSDCIIPPHYTKTVREFIQKHKPDYFGGPDAAHPSFTPIQKAISYTMTAFLTTGGIRGGKKKVTVFHPRSFNMGISKEAFQKTNGFSDMRFGEDLDLSLRVIENGFKSMLIEEAFVYHKRRTDFKKFFKQIRNSGIARINLYKRHPDSLKIVHFVPALFVLFTAFSLLLTQFCIYTGIWILLFYSILIFMDSSLKNKSPYIGFLSVISMWVQHTAYGTGFIKAVWKRLILKQSEFHDYRKNFYK